MTKLDQPPSGLSRRHVLGLGAAFMLGACSPALRGQNLLSAYPVAGRMMLVQGHKVHVHVAGRGPDVILLHGASANLRDFTFDLVGRLSGGFRTIAFDRPGLGYSDSIDPEGESPAEQAALLDAAAAQFGVRRAIVLGHSYGAAVAMAWAVYHPQRVAAAVTLSGVTMPWPGGLGPLNPILSSDLGGATLAPLLSALVPRQTAAKAVRIFFAPQAVPPGYAAHVGVDLALQPSIIRANARQIAILKPHIIAQAAQYPRVAIPVEVVHGTADRIVPSARHAAPFADTLPDARLTLLPGVGHMPHHVRLDRVVAIIRRAAHRAGLRPGRR
ncbi:Beta-ketoadipate enol-lactone hydrolase [Rhodovulum sp. P5]|uniref:alpha/beta fold hydrolase n=1 Tax=Rhodovulum sp. P5 TaxID=1564506 RepID=UPI0009C27D8F|nr:alpha/beta hydrolase [Rhodovulum sp. P5]ARE38265.1 Beta-ketoadipate enol-lactone hydrolase [Rhodovulum sp. P5]